MTETVFFDGVTNRRHVVALRLSDALEIVEDDRIIAIWPYANLRIVDAPQGAARFWCTDAPPLARLECRDAALAEAIAQRCTNPTGPGGVRPVSTGKIAFWSIAATLSIIATIWFGVPLLADEIADTMPYSWERPLGQAADKQIRVLLQADACTNADGVRALNKLVAGLRAGTDLQVTPDPVVLRSPIPNAFALPGGRVFVLSSLLDKSEDADELAGVLAHEFGHLSHRDGLRRLIRNGGTGFLVGLLFGDVSGSGGAFLAVRSLLNAAYSREVEEGADTFGIELMHKLGRPTAPLGRLLTRISGKGAEEFSLLNDHPMTPDRVARLEQPFAGTEGPPLLTSDEWKALKSICGPRARPRPAPASRPLENHGPQPDVEPNGNG